MFDFKETAGNFGQPLDESVTRTFDKNLLRVQAVLDASIKQVASQFDQAAGNNNIQTVLRDFRKYIVTPLLLVLFIFGAVLTGLAGFVIGHGGNLPFICIVERMGLIVAFPEIEWEIPLRFVCYTASWMIDQCIQMRFRLGRI